MIQELLPRIVSGAVLTEEEAFAIMQDILAGAATPAQIAGFSVALRMRGETVDEVTGLARALRQALPQFPDVPRPLLDTCGTGGDGSGTFNVSTAVAFVAAAAGARVAKHGNRAMSSRAGSADVLEALGASVDLTPGEAAKALREVGVAFLFAQVYHWSFKHASGPRRELGVRTVFNVLGTISNPAGAERQLVGVYDRTWVPRLAEVLGRLGAERAWVVHSEDGLDELSVFAPTWVARLENGKVTEDAIDPRRYGLAHGPDERSHVLGGSATENARILEAVLSATPGAAHDMVVLNAAAALVVGGIAPELEAGIDRARTLIDQGDARAKLDQFLTHTRRR